MTVSVLSRRLAIGHGTTQWGDFLFALRALLRRATLIDGDDLAAYEQLFAHRIGVDEAVSFATGRVGLYGLLRTFGVGPGDEVLLQVPTHAVVANAIRYTGATPVYVDCRLDDFNIDLGEAETRVTSRTKALILQHTFGIPADLDAAVAFARRHDLALIEDCVHALGASYADRPLGSFGDAAFFSTEETKTISSTMGGMVVTGKPEIAAAMRRFQRQCRPPERSLVRRYMLKFALYHVLTQPRIYRFARPLYEKLGRRNPLPQAAGADELRGEKPADYEQRLSNAQAALVLRQLERLQQNIDHRRLISGAYATELAAIGVRPPAAPPKSEAAFVRYPLWVTDRAQALAAAWPIAALGSWFTSVLEEAENPALLGYVPGSCPRAEAAARQLVNLPTHERVRKNDSTRIVAALAAYARSSSDEPEAEQHTPAAAQTIG